MKITDLKIGTQMKLGFAAMLIFVFILGVVSFQQSDQIHQQTETMFNHPLKTRRAIGELTRNILFMRMNIRDYLLVEDLNIRQSILNDLAINQANVLNEIEKVKECYLGPRQDIDDLSQEFTKWVTIRQETIRMLTDGKQEEARKRHVPGGIAPTQALNVLGALQKISDFAQIKGDELYDNSVRLKESLNRGLIILTLAILLLSIIINYLLLKNIRRPLNELTNATRSFHNGNLNARSLYESKNEFGTLSNSFNILAKSIQMKTNLDEKITSLAAMMLSKYEAKEFFRETIIALANHTDSQMAAVYLLNNNKKTFEHFDSTGLDSNARQSFSADSFEGEFGTVLSSRKVQYLKNIPDDTRFVFHAVSGKFIPREIITIPIITNNEVVAIFSLANISKYSKQSIQLIDHILDTLNARVEGILAYRRIKEFLEILEYQNHELEAQKTELASQSAELTEQNTELEMQKNHLDQANRMKTSFLSNMSHELRTPLNSVIALSGVLNRRLSGKVPYEEHSYIEVIERNGKQLLSLINDILDLSRIEAGYEEIEIRKFSVNELIHEVVELIEPQSNQKNIHLRYLVEDNLPDINCDYEKCRHILQNLVANAVKFTEVGGVEITVEATTETINIMVSDTGIGIDKEHLPHIFDEFRQADGSNSRKYGGTGLGLAIAKKYAEMLGGSITVESTRGEGSRFILNLPLQNTITEISKNAFIQPETPNTKYDIGHINQNEKTILLVEDTEAMIVQMKDMLESQGYNIMVARNGNEALKQIDVKIPDAMLLDLMMPEVDGFEVLKRVREEEKTNHLPVIILTAKYVTKEELGFLKNNGIVQLIRKGDINKDQMLEAISRMMFSDPKEVIAPEKKSARIRTSGIPVILVVEDNPDNMLTIKALLDRKATVIEAVDGQTGIDLAIMHQPNLILMDIALPGINGIEVLSELQKIEMLKHIPVIAVSASAMKGDREDFIACGFDGYISKPIDNIEFEKTLKEFLE